MPRGGRTQVIGQGDWVSGPGIRRIVIGVGDRDEIGDGWIGGLMATEVVGRRKFTFGNR